MDKKIFDDSTLEGLLSCEPVQTNFSLQEKLIAIIPMQRKWIEKFISFGFNINNLFEVKAEWDENVHSYETPLMGALRMGNTISAKSLIDCGCNIFEEAAPEDETAIFYAARHNNVEILEILLDKGEDINRRNWVFGNTPIFEAASCGAEDAVDYLLERGADVSIANTDGETIDLLAAKYGYMEIAKKLHKIVVEHLAKKCVLVQRFSYNETFWKFINNSKIPLPEVYKSVEMSRKTFSKMKSANDDYKPRKNNVLRLAIGLHLGESEATELLASAGYNFDSDSVRDSVVLQSIRSGEYVFSAIEREINRKGGKLLTEYD